MKTAFGKRPEGVLVMMTTPSLDTGKFARLEYDNAKQIAADRSLDPTYLPVIYEADEADDPFVPATWHKANPGLRSGFLDETIIRQEAEDAKRDATRLHPFKVLRCAIWAQAGGGFLDMTAWNEGATDFFTDSGTMMFDLAGMNCWFGLDMAGTTDLASLAMLFWDDEAEVAYCLWKHWSTTGMSGRLDDHTGGQWRVWTASDSVALRLFPGDWIPADEVAEEVLDLAEVYRPMSVGIDSFRSRHDVSTFRGSGRSSS